MALELKYRPSTLHDIIGNEILVSQLSANFTQHPPPKQTILLQGPRGCGKTTLARILCAMSGCTEINEIDVAVNGGKDEAVKLSEKVRALPLFGGNKAYILDEVHVGTNAFFNALLKTLEEPPSHVFFFLCTTEPESVLRTVRSRCATYTVEALSTTEIKALLSKVLKKEKTEVDTKILSRIAATCDGIPREALIMLEKVMSSANLEKSLSQIEQKENEIRDLAQALIQQKSWSEVARILTGLKNTPEETIRRSILGYVNAMVLNGRANPNLFHILECFRDPFFQSGRAGLSLACYDASTT